MAYLDESLDVISTTLNAWAPEMPNAILNNNAALFYFKSFGKMGLIGKNKEPMGSIETLDGGLKIEIDVKIKENPNIGFVDYTEAAPIVEEDSTIQALYNWKFCYGNAPISKAKIDANSGSRYKKHNLVKTIIDVAQASMINNIGAGLWNTTEPKGLQGFPVLISDDGTSTGAGAVGGISTATYPNWKNQFINLPVSHTPAELREALEALFLKCKFGADSPDVIFAGATLYAEIKGFMTVNERFLSTEKVKKMAAAGFECISFNGAVVIYDENCPANRIYFVNSGAIGFYFHEQDVFTVGEREKKYGVFQYNYPLSSTCALVCKNRRRNGVLVVTDATTTTTTTTTTV